jgi:molecular chaperone DnaJ
LLFKFLEHKFRGENFLMSFLCVVIFSQVRVSYIDAILGTQIKVATVDGDVDLKISAGTQPETVTRLEGKGAPKLGGKGRGDQFVTIKVDIPTSVSSSDRELLMKLKEGATAGKGFFSK